MTHGDIVQAVNAVGVAWSFTGGLCLASSPRASDRANTRQLSWMVLHAEKLGWTAAKVGFTCRDFVDGDTADYMLLMAG